MVRIEVLQAVVYLGVDQIMIEGECCIADRLISARVIVANVCII